MPKVRASSGTIGTISLPNALSRSSLVSMRTNAIVVETARPSEPSRNSANDSSRPSNAMVSDSFRRCGR